MPALNANIPYQRAWVRNEYILGEKGLTPCYIFGVKSILNKPMLFHCQLNNGALYWSLPISAFVHKEKFQLLGTTEKQILSNLQYWDCQSSSVAVTVFSYLQGYTVDYRARNMKWYRGKYLFTIDNYFDDNNSLPLGYASDSDSKCTHFIELDNGNYALSPNTYLRFLNSNFVDPYELENPPRYRANNFDLRAEE